MHFTTVATAFLLGGSALAHPGMGRAMAVIQARAALQPRQNTGGLIGDLETQGPTTDTGRAIARMLQNQESAQLDSPAARSSGGCAAKDPCCPWYDVSQTLTSLFVGPTGRCNDLARAAVRAGFHDAGTWSKSRSKAGEPFGGADGSLIMDFGEIDRTENNGLQDIVRVLREVQKKHNVGFADLVQYAHNHAVISCPLGPRIRTFVGRFDAQQAAPTGLLPDTHDDPDAILALFKDKTIDAHDLAALLGAHATARARFVPECQGIKPLDTTPGVWDVAFYNETLQNPHDPRICVLPSDAKLSVHPKVKKEWREFVGDQKHWNEDYAKAYVRLSLLGVYNINQLKECTKTLPTARPQFEGASEPMVLE